METPWGDTEQLRRARLHPGIQPHGRQRTEAHQRRRIFAWMVATAGRHGYAGARMHELAQGSGVAPSELYKLFAGKEECFLTAVDVIHEQALARVLSAYRSEEDPEAALRAAFAELAQSALSQPAAARMALVHVYEVGEQGLARAERAAASCEALLAQCLARSRQRCSLPAQLPGAIAGAVQMMIHDRLRRGREDELPAMMDHIAAWTLSYRSPPAPLARSRALVRPSKRRANGGPEQRLLYAIAELCVRKGYRNVSVNALAAHAKTSLRTLYERYGGKEQCFLACFEMVRERTLAAASAAYEPLMDDWPRAFHAAIEAIMRCFASEPALARLVAVEVLAAGPVAFEQRDEAIRSFIRLVEPGYEHAPRSLRIAREAIPFGIYAMVHRHLARGRPACTLPQLVPVATFFALAPAIGAEQAAHLAGEKPPRRRGATVSRGGGAQA